MKTGEGNREEEEERIKIVRGRQRKTNLEEKSEKEGREGA